jgi:hypothetical protein
MIALGMLGLHRTVFARARSRPSGSLDRPRRSVDDRVWARTFATCTHHVRDIDPAEITKNRERRVPDDVRGSRDAIPSAAAPSSEDDPVTGICGWRADLDCTKEGEFPMPSPSRDGV